MARAGATAAGLGIALAVGAAAWLLVSGGAGGAGEHDDLLAERGGAREEGPVLAGRVGAAPLAVEPAVDGEFDVSGTVVDEDDRPVAGVSVGARHAGAAPPRDSWRETQERERQEAFSPPPAETWDAKAASGADGAFRLRVRRRGTWLVRALPAPPLAGTSTQAEVGGERAPGPLRLRVLPGSALRGRVVDATGRGVEAHVRATAGDGSWRGPWTGSAPGTGAFALDAVRNGALDLEVLLPGRWSLSGFRVEAPTSEEVLLRVGGASPLATGTVKDQAGRPVAGARVTLEVEAWVADGGRGAAVEAALLARSDESGAFALAGGVTGRVRALHVDATGFLPFQEEPPRAAWSGLALDAARPATFAVVLWRGGALEGRVLERGTGKPLEGAVVEVFPSAVDPRVGQVEMRSARSDAAGRFVVEGLPVGRSLTLLRHPTHFFVPVETLRGQAQALDALETSSMTPPPEATVFVEREGHRVARDFELVAGVPVPGRVVDGEGAPVEGAQVFAQGLGLGEEAWRWDVSEEEEPRAVATSGADGRFTVPGLPPRKQWTLHALKPPLCGERSQPFPLVAGTPPAEVVLRLARPASVSGRVLDERGDPVRGADVHLWSNDDGEGTDYVGPDDDDREALETDGSGAFRFEGVTPGGHRVWAHASGKGDGWIDLATLGEGEARTGVELRLAAGSRSSFLRGVLVHEDGTPARGRDLFFTSNDGRHNTHVRSGERDGSFDVPLPAGRVRVGAGDWSHRVPLTEVDAPAANLRIVWKEPARQLVEGLVVDPQGRPVPLCRVHVYRVGPDGGSQGGESRFAVNGWFRESVSGPPPYAVSVSAPQDAAGRPLNLRRKTVPLDEAPTAPVTVTLEAGAEVAGRVVDPSGRGVPQVPVSVGGVGVFTDAQGAFAVGGLGTDAVDLEVSPPAPWVRPASRRVVAGGAPEVVALKEGLVVTGVVRGERGHNLAGNGQVSASWGAGPGHPEGQTEAWLERDGHFRIEALPPGAVLTLEVYVWTSGGRTYADRRLEGVAAGTQDLLIDLTAGVEVSGTAFDAAGKPLRRGYVILTSVDGEPELHQWAEIASDGTFRVVGLAPRRLRLTLHRQDGGPAPTPVEVEAPASGVRIVAPAATPLKGRLVGAGDAAGTFRVWAWRVAEKEGDPDGKDLRAVSVASDGTFVLSAAGAGGRWMLAARADGDDRFARAGPVPAGSEDVVLRLQPGASIEGTVVGLAGADLPRDTSVSLSGQHWSAHVKPDAQGRFTIRGLPEGTYDLSATTWANGHAAAEAEVAAGQRDVRLVLVEQKDE